MTSRERVRIAMRLGEPDRVPVMCQLALGHYFLRSGLDPIEIWQSTEGFGDALIRLQRRYGFDGILVNLPGRDPDWRRWVDRIEERTGRTVIRWRNGWYTAAPPDDVPHVFRPDGSRPIRRMADIDPESLFYVEPHAIGGPACPFAWGFDEEPRRTFPPYQYDTITYVLARAGDVSIHAELFSPFSQLLELVEYTDALMALVDNPGKVKACLNALADGAIELGRGQAQAGADAILISSAFAGAGFISPRHYREFVLPFERKVIDGIRARYDIPIYTHTCGAIGDRLELMAETGTSGIDTLDPPPLGTVDLSAAREQTRGRLFIKGNVDPVNTMLMGGRDDVVAAARERILTAGPGGGYILSTACSVPPAAPPENIQALVEAAEMFGQYPIA
ncbi:MAG: uroporphyrinogen decarboxylase family protein [Acidobacteriota bacterium]